MLGKKTKYKIVEMEDGSFIVKRKLRFSPMWSHLSNPWYSSSTYPYVWAIHEHDPYRFYSKERAREGLENKIKEELEDISERTIKNETLVEIIIK